MNQNVVTYLQENKDKFSREALADQLKASGYGEQEIQEGVAFVYGDSPVTPTPAIRYAGFWIRLLACIIDGIVLIIPNMVISYIIQIAPFGTVGSILSSVSGLLVSWIYAILMLNKYQATVGKMALSLTVISNKNAKLDMNQIILRETIGKLVSGIILGIGYIMAAFSDKKEALHDKIAKTNVIYKA